jgi:UDP-N-acetylmuramoylalanine--D-glutamate ligase
VTDLRRVLVIGLAVTGQAVTRALLARGIEVVAVDDHPSAAARSAAQLIDVDLLEAPDIPTLQTIVEGADAVVPSPGIPDHHPVFAIARSAGIPVMSEFDLAARWDERPLVAVTGTDGKTTVTTLITDMLVASGIRAVAAGNTEVPLVEAIDDDDVDTFVVEASSFRLGHTQRFRPAVATWLNFAPDHLDVHASLDSYEQAKARIWTDLASTATAVANADDEVVYRHVPAQANVVTFGLTGTPDAHLDGDVLVDQLGRSLVSVAELHRTLPHDLANALAASATAVAAGASVAGVRQALLGFKGLPHRVELVGAWNGVTWFDDSKATVPHATLAAVSGFDSVVLIAGGRNKGLDLAALTAAGPKLKAVVAIGEAAADIGAAMTTLCPVVLVETSIDDAVHAAADLAEAGDVVLLSPGCASFDWFSSYHERGLAFQAAVRRLMADGPLEVDA